MRLFAWTQTFKSIVKYYQAVCCDRDILNRRCLLVFGTPEARRLNGKRRKILSCLYTLVS